MEPIIVTTTCDEIQNAEEIAEILIKKQRAACVQISSPVKSIYRWQGAIETSKEYVVSIKSCRSLFNDIAETIKKTHSYEVPEIIATDIAIVDTDYQQWLSSVLRIEAS